MQDTRKAKWLLGRAAIMTIAALPVVIALTYPGMTWFEQLKRWMHHAPRAAVRGQPWRPGPGHVPISVTPERPLGTDSSVSPVPLPLILVHTVPGRNSTEGFAQIGVNARTPQTYRAGALLANGARLSEIYTDHVILSRNGRSVRLDLHGARVIGTQPAAELLTVGGSLAPAAARPANHDALTDYLRPSPVFQGGRLHGYVLYAGRYQDPFFKMGLEPGDVVIQVNGMAVSDATRALASLHSLVDGAALTVEIERAGAAQTLALDGTILAQAIASPPAVAPDLPWRSPPGSTDFDATSLSNAPSH